jgi:hypothetical protein
MSKGRVSNNERVSHRPPLGGTEDVHRFIGISLGGGKADKACIAVVEYFPQYKKIFLSKIFDKIKTEGSISADLKIHEIIESFNGKIDSVAFDVPWRPPICFRCENPCTGYETCQQEHIVWMREHNLKQQKKKKPKKLFSPYLERCAEMYIKSELEEPMDIGPALGANTAPLLARASYIQRRIKVPTIEVYPKLSIWRVGRALNISKSHLRFHRHSVGGQESRASILQELTEHNVVFVYAQDQKLMAENNHAFEAFICALTGYLKYSGQTEPRPKSFPSKEDWIEFPQQKIRWPS